MSRKKLKQAKANWENQGHRSVDTLDYSPQEDWGEPDTYCERCYNTGELDCHCGGDLCVCENNGTYPCPDCFQ